MSAIFNFQSLLTVILLLICTCAYIRSLAPSVLDKNKTGLLGIFWKCARIGIRYVSLFKSSDCSTDQQALFKILSEVAQCQGIMEEIGERKSPYVAVCCIVMAFSILFIQ